MEASPNTAVKKEWETNSNDAKSSLGLDPDNEEKTTISFTHKDNNEIQKSSKLTLSESSIPTTLLSEEETLENLLDSSSKFLSTYNGIGGGRTSIGKVSGKNDESHSKTQSGNDSQNSKERYDAHDDDEMNEDLSRLAAAEEDIRTELEMLMNADFGGFSYGFSNDNCNDDTHSFHRENHDFHDINKEYSAKNNYTETVTDKLASPPSLEIKTKRKNRHKTKPSCDIPVNSEEQDDHNNVDNDLLDTMSLAEIEDRFNWKKQGEEMGIRRMIQEEIKDKVDGHINNICIYKCPLPNSIYDYIMDHSTESKNLFPADDSSISSSSSSTPQIFPNQTPPILSKQQKQILFYCNSEYILPMTTFSLCKIYAGLLPPRSNTSDTSQGITHNPTELLKYLSISSQEQTNTDSIEQEEEEEQRRQQQQQRSNQQQTQTPKQSSKTEVEYSSEPLPIRTCTLRIRPDVLCGAVMDCLSHIVMFERGGEIVKRQGGHLLAVLPGFWFRKKKKRRYGQDNLDDVDNWIEGEMIFNEDGGCQASPLEKKKKKEKKKKRKIFLPPLCMDAQLCTKKRGEVKGDQCERILLIRFYEIKANNNSNWESILDPMDEKDCEFGKESNDEVKEKYSDEHDILSDFAYVLYQMKKEEGEIKHNPKPIQRPSSKIGDLLISPIRMFSKKGNTNSPNTSNKHTVDHQRLEDLCSSTYTNLLHSAFRFITTCISELETRELLYTTLFAPGTKFGVFPALSTLDVQYCSQMRLACRESMILNLLKTAAGLEQFAREAEMKCLGFVRLLVEGAIKDYGVDLPSVPNLIPLTAYPLNFKPPEAICPPWGPKVMDALQSIALINNKKYNEITPMNPDINPLELDDPPSKDALLEFENAMFAVQKVISAFQLQDDEELAARVRRKNLQVTDRMMKMQALRSRSLNSISNSYQRNDLARKAADHFHSMASQAKIPPKVTHKKSDTNHESNKFDVEYPKPSFTFFASEQVPILKCGIVIEGAPGTCYVTTNQILFAANIGFLTGYIYTVMTIAEVHLIPVEINLANSLFDSSSKLGLSIRINMQNESYCNTDENDAANETKKSVPIRRKKDTDWIMENTIELFSFVPSIPVDKFKAFIEMIRTIKEESIE